LAVDFGFALEISLDMRDAKSMFAVSIVELGLKKTFDAKTVVQSSSNGRANYCTPEVKPLRRFSRNICSGRICSGKIDGVAVINKC